MRNTIISQKLIKIYYHFTIFSELKKRTKLRYRQVGKMIRRNKVFSLSSL